MHLRELRNLAKSLEPTCSDTAPCPLPTGQVTPSWSDHANRCDNAGAAAHQTTAIVSIQALGPLLHEGGDLDRARGAPSTVAWNTSRVAMGILNSLPGAPHILKKQGCGSIFGISGNARLSKNGQPWCEDVPARLMRPQ